MPDPALMSVIEAAEYLRISRSSIYRLFGDGTLTKRKVGGRTLVSQADMDDLIERSAEAQKQG